MNHYYDLKQITEPINKAKPEIKTIVEQVLKLEKEKLSQRNLRHINDDILQIIKENIK